MPTRNEFAAELWAGPPSCPRTTSWLVFAGGKAHLFGDNEDNRTLCGLSWEDHPDQVLEETVDGDQPSRPVCARCASIERSARGD